MANEARVGSSLIIRKVSGSATLIDYRSPGPGSFQVTVSGSKGPTPGALTVDVTGEDVGFTELTTPGLCVIKNLSADYHVEWGVHDGSLFHPVGEVLPGEVYVIRLSRNLGEEHTEPGTGTTGVVNSFYVRCGGTGSNTAVVSVEAFEA